MKTSGQRRLGSCWLERERVKTEATGLEHDDIKLLKQEVDTIEGLVRAEATEQIAVELQSVQSTREGHYGYAHSGVIRLVSAYIGRPDTL